MYNFSRRHFIAGLGGLWATYVISRDAELAPFRKLSGKLGRLIGASPQSALFIGGELSGYRIEHNLFYSYDLDSKVHRELEIPMGLAHDTIVSPVNSDLALVIEREGPYACLIDVGQMRVVKRIEAESGHFFTGSGIFSGDGNYLYLGQYSLAGQRTGQIGIWDGTTLRQKKSLDTGAAYPHSFTWLTNGSLAVGHYLGVRKIDSEMNPPLISIYDGKLENLISKVQPPVEGLDLCQLESAGTDKLFVMTHNTRFGQEEHFGSIRNIKSDYNLAVTKRPEFIDFEQTPSPLVTVDLSHGEPQAISVSETKEGFKWGLSLAANPSAGVVAGTHGLGGTLSFQSLATGELLHEHRFENENPRAVIVSQSGVYFVVTTDRGNLHYFNSGTFRLERTENPAPGRYNFMVQAKVLPA